MQKKHGEACGHDAKNWEAKNHTKRSSLSVVCCCSNAVSSIASYTREVLPLDIVRGTAAQSGTLHNSLEYGQAVKFSANGFSEIVFKNTNEYECR
jgi:hypothetical protein